MAKGKNANPADAFRKAQRKKELKKNKADRAKARDFALVKKDTKDIEEEIEKLESGSDGNTARLNELKTELEKITKKKEEWVAEHPEHKKLVFRARKTQGEKNTEDVAPVPQSRNLFNKHGLPRHPERSIYYDPVMNPYGVPPPGMPYIERPLHPDEAASDKDSDDDIVMPAGPPPTAFGEEVDSDDDIPMPDGPPPPRDGFVQMPPLPPALPNQVPHLPPPPGGPPPLPSSGFPPFSAGHPLNLPPPPPLPLPSSLPLHPPLPPVGFPPFPPPPQAGIIGAPPIPFMPPPPPGFMPQQFPPPPPGFFPRRSQSQASVQDPLSSIPHQTFQAHREARATASLPSHPSLPPKPTAASTSATPAAISSEATVSAAPELRDFKKESTAFVPAAIRKKKASATNAKINAAPSVESTEESTADTAPRPDLLSTLRAQLGTKVQEPVKQAQADPVSRPKDDYAKFLDEMSDILAQDAT